MNLLKNPNRGGALTPNDIGTAERRREPRIPCNREIGVLPCDASDDRGFRPMRMTDCSRRGIALIGTEPMNPGERFMVKLKLDQVVLLVYTVRRCVPEGREFRIGAELDDVIGLSPNRLDEVLQALLS